MTVKHSITNNVETVSVKELMEALDKIEDKDMPVVIYTDLRICPYIIYPMKLADKSSEVATEKGYLTLHIGTLKGKTGKRSNTLW